MCFLFVELLLTSFMRKWTTNQFNALNSTLRQSFERCTFLIMIEKSIRKNGNENKLLFIAKFSLIQFETRLFYGSISFWWVVWGIVAFENAKNNLRIEKCIEHKMFTSQNLYESFSMIEFLLLLLLLLIFFHRRFLHSQFEIECVCVCARVFVCESV